MNLDASDALTHSLNKSMRSLENCLKMAFKSLHNAVHRAGRDQAKHYSPRSKTSR